MYSSFTIQNFRGFEHLEFNDLARINLIAGTNNVGKTSVLEALMLHTGHFSPIALMRNGVDKEYKVENSFQWDVLFHNFEPDKKIILTGDHPSFPQFPYTMEISIVD